jgi:hypothetical protein
LLCTRFSRCFLPERQSNNAALQHNDNFQAGRRTFGIAFYLHQSPKLIFALALGLPGQTQQVKIEGLDTTM